MRRIMVTTATACLALLLTGGVVARGGDNGAFQPADSSKPSVVEKPTPKKSAPKKNDARAALERRVKAAYARLEACEEDVRGEGRERPVMPSRPMDADETLEYTKEDRRWEREEEAIRQKVLVKCGGIRQELQRLTKEYRDKYKVAPKWR